MDVLPFVVPIAAVVRAQICAGIRSGGFAHVAAEASGVPREVLVQWLELGSRAGAVEPYAGFVAEVRQAMAQARLAAEIAAFQKDPKVWLEHGPGKETPGNPGWTGVPPASAEEDWEFDVFAHPEVLEFLRRVREALAEHPEACAKVARRLDEEGAGGRAVRVFWGRIG